MVVEAVRTILCEDGRGHQVLEDAAVAVERAHHLTPHKKLADLLGQFPQFLQEEAKEVQEVEGHIRRVRRGNCNAAQKGHQGATPTSKLMCPFGRRVAQPSFRK